MKLSRYFRIEKHWHIITYRIKKTNWKRHGRSQNFFGREPLFQKKFQKILKKYSKNIQKYSTKIQKIFKNFKKFQKIFKFFKFPKTFKKSLKIFKIFFRNVIKIHYFHERPRHFFGGEVRSTWGGLGSGVAAWGVPAGGAPGRRRSFQKICKKSMKNL